MKDLFRKGSLLRRALFYNIFGGVEALVPIILAPILTRYLTTEEYGLWALFQTLTTSLVPIAGLGLQNAVRMRYMELSKNDRASYFASAISLKTFISSLILLIVVLFSDYIEEITQFPAAWMGYTVITAYLWSIFLTVLSYFQFGSEFKRFAVAHITKTSFTLTLSIIFVIQKFGWKGLIIAKIAGLIVAILIAFIMIKKLLDGYKPQCFRKDYLKELLKFGIEHLPSGQTIIIISLINRLYIANFVSVAEAGVFAVANMFAMLLFIAMEGFYYAWLPWMFSGLIGNTARDKRKITLALIGYYAILPVGGYVIVILAKILGPIVLGENFHTSLNYVAALTTVMVIQGYLTVNLSFIHFTKRVKYMSLCGLIAIIIDVVAAYLLIPQYGTLGVAYGNMIAFAIAASVSAIIAYILVFSKWKGDKVASN